MVRQTVRECARASRCDGSAPAATDNGGGGRPEAPKLRDRHQCSHVLEFEAGPHIVPRVDTADRGRSACPRFLHGQTGRGSRHLGGSVDHWTAPQPTPWQLPPSFARWAAVGEGEERQVSRSAIQSVGPSGPNVLNIGSPTWARTRDLRINSPSLYQLSYRGTAFHFTVFAVIRSNSAFPERASMASHFRGPSICGAASFR